MDELSWHVIGLLFIDVTRANDHDGNDDNDNNSHDDDAADVQIILKLK